MKITEARSVYGAQINAYREQQNLLTQRKKELEKAKSLTTEDAVIYEKELGNIALQYEALEEKKTEYQEYMARLGEFEATYMELLSSKEQGDAVSEAYEDLGKIMEVARRIMRGDIVPATDERKLMEFSDELYQAAKNIGELMRQKEREEHESLWEEEDKIAEEGGDAQDIFEAVGEMEAPAGPAIEAPTEALASVECSVVSE